MQIKKNEEKFIQLYNSYVDEIYQFVYIRTNFDKQKSEDLTQDIFLEVYKSLGKFKGLSSKRTWIFKIARNKINDYYRKKYKSFDETIDIQSDQVISINDLSQNVEVEILKECHKQLIRYSLEKIPDKYKLILTLKYIDELSVKEIAVLLGKTNKSIDSMLQRAKKSYIKEYYLLREENLGHE